MTTYLTKTALQQYLEDRIAELIELDRQSHDALHEQAMASELSSLLRLIGDGAFTVNESDNADQQQDPLEEAADRVLNGNLAETVRNLAVGDVVSVSTILYRRAGEAEVLAKELYHARNIFDEKVRQVMDPEVKSESDEAAFLAGPQPNVHIAERSARERLYNETGLRDRNGGR